jgi:hypothetical protein
MRSPPPPLVPSLDNKVIWTRPTTRMPDGTPAAAIRRSGRIRSAASRRRRRRRLLTPLLLPGPRRRRTATTRGDGKFRRPTSSPPRPLPTRRRRRTAATGRRRPRPRPTAAAEAAILLPRRIPRACSGTGVGASSSRGAGGRMRRIIARTTAAASRRRRPPKIGTATHSSPTTIVRGNIIARGGLIGLALLPHLLRRPGRT